MEQQAFGVDIGNVIINHRLSDPNDTTLHEERYSTIPAVEGAVSALKLLNEKFNGEIYLISKCTEWAQEKILAWLQDNNFYDQTGINPEHVLFCRERKEKEGICRTYHITHFIDDRLEVLSHMIGTTPHLFLFQPKESEVEEFKEFLPKVTRVESWDEVLQQVS